jgi:hypothetical protein
MVVGLTIHTAAAGACGFRAEGDRCVNRYIYGVIIRQALIGPDGVRPGLGAGLAEADHRVFRA